MHPIITDRRAAIADLCRRYGVRRLEVFGSALRDDFDTASSDIDLVVDFAAAPAGTAFDRYFDLKSALESLFARPVDLVQLHALQSPRLQRLIERAKVPVYAAPAESSTTAAWMSASVFMISKTVPRCRRPVQHAVLRRHTTPQDAPGRPRSGFRPKRTI